MVRFLGLVDLAAEDCLLRLLVLQEVAGLDGVPARLLADLLGALGSESAWWTH